jgi:3',5'-cyclic AMP phosphodiesterase CpdA
MIRLAHFSDIHLTAPQLGWTLRDLCNKRLAAWMNFRWLGRRRRFSRADTVLGQLIKEIVERQPEKVIFSGDATAMGFEEEIRRSADILGVGRGRMPSGLAVPGNHDYCTREAAASGNFERHFAPWQTGFRLEPDTYPFAQRVGHVHLVAVNSCTGNIWPWDASGSVGGPQRQRLGRLLAALEPGPRILITHYPVCLSSGRRENPVHGLRDLAETIEVAANGGIGLWLHGHRHQVYYFQKPPQAPFPVICIGSATQNGLWSYGEYTVEGCDFRVLIRKFDRKSGKFLDCSRFEVRLN